MSTLSRKTCDGVDRFAICGDSGVYLVVWTGAAGDALGVHVPEGKNGVEHQNTILYPRIQLTVNIELPVALILAC